MSPDIRKKLSEIKDLQGGLDLIAQLIERLEFLEKENAQLKEKIAHLEKNSSTSSKPPSSDITKPPNERRQPGKRKRGGQPGHKGAWRLKLQPDKVQPVSINSCPVCKGHELGEEQEGNVKICQQVELVSKPVQVTEYHLQGRYCPCCDKIQYPELPQGVIPDQIFGPKLLSLCGHMKGNFGVSVSDIRDFLADVFQIPVARSTIQNAIFRVSNALAPAYEEAMESLPHQEKLNVDETGWKENGKRLWVWMFCSQALACFAIRPSRGCKVLKEILGEVFGGALTSDFYSAYVSYATALQQFCLAHFIRDVKFLTTLSCKESQAFGKKLLDYMRRIFSLWHRRTELTSEQFRQRASRLENSLRIYVFAQRFKKGSDARRIQMRMTKHWDSMFRFLKQPELFEPTNNTAEQALRLLVRLRKISQGSRSLAGQVWTARAATIVVSCKKQSRSTWDFIQQAVSAHFFGTPQPSLIRGN